MFALGHGNDRNVLVVLATVLACPLQGQQPAPGQSALVTLFHAPDALERTFVLRLPLTYDNAANHPVLVVLHPAMTNGVWMENETGISTIADQEGFIALYPNGLRLGATYPQATQLSWNGAYQFRCQPPDIPDDTGFVIAAVDWTAQNYNVDLSRIYLTGFSQGAQLANTIVRLHPGRIAAIAPVSGGWMEAWCDTDQHPCVGCEDEVPLVGTMPVWIWRGSLENMTNNPKSMSRAVQDQMQRDWYIQHNQTAITAVTDQESIVAPNRQGRPTTYVLTTSKYLNGTNGAEVWFTEVTAESHRWQPGATDRIWSFVSRYSLTSSQSPTTSDTWMVR